MTRPIRIALIGLGKIAHDQHLPAITASPSFELVATVSRHGEGVAGKPFFTSIEQLAQSGIEVDAVAVCTPPQARRRIAALAIEQGWHVFLEKPPAATLAEIVSLRDAATAKGVSLFASWHSRFAPGVEAARNWLATREIDRVQIIWREDVRVWHPGQDWIWEPGGFGVFDPGINALSIATRILPRPFWVESGEVDIPANRASPIAARVRFADDRDTPIELDLDFRQEGTQSWDFVIETDAGRLTLANGGATLSIQGVQSGTTGDDLHGEYHGLYRRFAEVVRADVSDVDVAPLRLVGDALIRSKISIVEPFDW